MRNVDYTRVFEMLLAKGELEVRSTSMYAWTKRFRTSIKMVIVQFTIPTNLSLFVTGNFLSAIDH